MDELTLALLGNKEAQDRFTERGNPLPCPGCKHKAEIRYSGNGSGPLGYITNYYQKSKPGLILCPKCGFRTQNYSRVGIALKNWNTRTQILTDEQMKHLEEIE